MHRLVFIFFLFSGFSSLVFEVIWARMLQQVFGTTSFAISTLLTAFMAGLAIGSLLGGRLARQVKSPLRIYGILEASIGLYALLVPLLLAYLPTLYAPLFERFMGDFYLFSLLRFVAVFVILVLPTTLMGATLPLVSQWLADRQRIFHGSIGLLYGANTLGACLGTFLAGFVLLPAFGLHTTNLIFVGVNLALGAAVLLSYRRLERSIAHEENPELQAELSEDDMALIQGGTALARPIPTWALRLTLTLFGLTGLVAMSYQVLWTRAYVITLGSSTYSFTLVLTAILIAIALGSVLVSPLLKRVQRPIYLLALLQALVAASATVGFYVLDRIPAFLYDRARDTISGVGEIYAYQFGLVALVVFLPSLFQGMSFPVVVRAVNARIEETGEEVGAAYAFNTAGSIVGSFAAGFVIMPWLGMQRAIATMILVNLTVAALLCAIELSQRFEPRRALTMLLALLTGASLFYIAPPIDRARLSAGMFRVHLAREVYSPKSFESSTPEILYYEDGLTATTSVEKRGGGVALKANGKPEASDGADMDTQILVGLLPFVARSAFADVALGQEEAAMVGFGSGVTAGASLQWPLKRLEVVEIEATMIEASRFFEHVNHRPLEDPRHVLIESDGRNYLEYSPRTYDVIVSEPSNPWIAGVSSLFTVEYFERVRQKLNPGGVYGQWVQLYELHPDNVRRVFATFLAAFPHVHAFSSKAKSTDLILLGSDRPLAFPPEGFERAWSIDTVRTELQRVGIKDVMDLYGLAFMNQAELEAFAAGSELNTDDNGLLEFNAPHDLIFYSVGELFFARHYFSGEIYGDLRPYLQNWPTDWSPNQIARLARGAWRAGKADLARDILHETGLRNARGRDPLLDELIGVLDADHLPIAPAAEATFAASDDPYQEAAQRAGSPQGAKQVIQELYEQQRAPRQGYDGRRGLLHAYALTVSGDARGAQRQLDHLHNIPDVTHTPLYPLLAGQVYQARRRYREAYRALSLATLATDLPTPHPPTAHDLPAPVNALPEPHTSPAD
ncbi:hypothetical protein DL240_04320 [Lujinxingia litoralis]|uniref:Major facilitator superfamily (MFS) profile domain-containing protein n=1 Tax=Lujinxingia litoralis TaxID=2211119 RepID=A0A328CB80_9DELT|nr:fused MFS/spermidine synthase [Lujinxingia litoralis]RAL25442.1 hypothetical protein DL240_04320 [Lujinxingia litoralis]